MTLIEKSFVDTREMDARIGLKIKLGRSGMKIHANTGEFHFKLKERSLKSKMMTNDKIFKIFMIY